MSTPEDSFAAVSAAKKAVEDPSSQEVEREQLRWQRRVLPLMAGTLIALTAVFVGISAFETRDLQRQAGKIEALDMEKELQQIMARHQQSGQAVNYDQIRWESLAVLEAQALNRRYTHARILLIESIWSRFLGFITGMILALIGAAFVLGKLRESNSTINAGASLWKMSISTASPGLALATLGTALMLSTILVRNEITVNDGTAYLQQLPVANPGPHGALPAFPSPFPLPPSTDEPDQGAGKNAPGPSGKPPGK